MNNDLAILTSSALLGTDRSPLGKLENPHLETARSQLSGDATTQLLSVAALGFNMAKAGQSASNASALPEAAAGEDKPVVPVAAQIRLRQLFAQHPQLIPEWLELAVQQGYVLPHGDVIAMLDYGRQNTELRGAVQPLLGTRGRWLAQQNVHWAWATGDTSSEENTIHTWETGNKAARALALSAIRASNPEQARTLLQAVWKSEPADERKTFLALLEPSLSDADEPFLELCLDDRSKDVRGIAANLLAKLPDSKFVERMKSRATKLLLHGKKELEVVLPEWEDGFLRDGLEKKSPLYNVGEKAYWWQTIVARVPLEFWQEHFQLAPPEILKRLPKTWKGNFIDAILTQTLSPEWAEALLNHNKQMLENSNLLGSLPQDRREVLIVREILTSNTQNFWIDSMRCQWSLGFCDAVAQHLVFTAKKLIAGANQYRYCAEYAHHIHRDLLEAWRLNPDLHSVIAELEQAKEKKKNNAWYIENFLGELQALLSALETRAQMRKELLS